MQENSRSAQQTLRRDAIAPQTAGESKTLHEMSAAGLQASRLVNDGRATLLTGDFEITPGIQLFHIPGHSPGHMSLKVWTQRGWVLLAVDASHFKANMVQRRPYPLYLDLKQIMDGYDRLAELAPDLDHIVCGHDSTTIDLYPAASPDLKDKVVRLDLPPLA